MVSDENLMAGIQQGDQGAMEVLVKRYHNKIYEFLYRKMKGHHMAEDIAQECFVRICTKAHQYQYPKPFKPWLYTIANNLCINYFNSGRHKKEATVDDEFYNYQTDDSKNPEEETADKLEGEYIKTVLGELPEEQRTIVILRFYEDMKVKDIAAIMEIPEGTVKSRLYYAVKILKDKFSKYGIKEDLWS